MKTDLYHPVYANGEKVAVGDLVLWEDYDGILEICTVIDFFMGVQNSPSDDILLVSERDGVPFSERALDIKYIVKKTNI